MRQGKILTYKYSEPYLLLCLKEFWAFSMCVTEAVGGETRSLARFALEGAENRSVKEQLLVRSPLGGRRETSKMLRFGGWRERECLDLFCAL